MNTKKILNPNSKQHWAGWALGVFGGILTFLPTAREFIPADQYGNILIAVSVGVIILRNVTNKPIDER